jgi:hypothetical protein
VVKVLCYKSEGRWFDPSKVTADFQMWHYSKNSSMPLQAGTEDVEQETDLPVGVF